MSETLFKKNGYENLGFFSNAVVYLLQGICAVYAILIMQSYGDVKNMAIGSIISIPYMLSMIAPALRYENMSDHRFYYSKPFVYSTVLLASAFNGAGQGFA